MRSELPHYRHYRISRLLFRINKMLNSVQNLEAGEATGAHESMTNHIGVHKRIADASAKQHLTCQRSFSVSASHAKKYIHPAVTDTPFLPLHNILSFLILGRPSPSCRLQLGYLSNP